MHLNLNFESAKADDEASIAFGGISAKESLDLWNSRLHSELR